MAKGSTASSAGLVIHDDPDGGERDARLASDRTAIFLFEGPDAERLDGLDDIPGRLGKSTLVWVDVSSPSESTARRIADELDLDEAAERALVARSPGPGFRDGGGFVHLTVHAPTGAPDDRPTEIECVVGDNWVVTSHDGPVAVLDEVTGLAAGSGATGELDGPTFLAVLLEWVLNEYTIAFERLEQDLEELDERAMRGRRSAEEEIEHLVNLRRKVSRLRRALVAHRSPILALTYPELEALGDPATARRFEALLDRHAETVQSARDARESIVSSFDVLIARTGHRTNEIVKILTLASVVLLPGALVAGVMGMNFKIGLFTHPVGFWVVVSAIVSIGVVTIAVAKLRNWL